MRESNKVPAFEMGAASTGGSAEQATQEGLNTVTIVVSVKVRDGLVMATDSMTSVYATNASGGPEHVKSYEHGRKLFQILDLPVGAMTYGLGNIGKRSMEGLVRDASRQMQPGTASVESVAKALYKFIAAEYQAAFGAIAKKDRPVCGFLVAGYSPEGSFGECYGFEFPRSTAGVSKLGEPDDFGAVWRGITLPFVRLWRGFDPGLAARTLQRPTLTEEEYGQMTKEFEVPVNYEGMPVQDAVSFATYILDTTIGYTKFAEGLPLCGGPLQVAAVLPDAGFSWIAKPELHIPPRP